MSETRLATQCPRCQAKPPLCTRCSVCRLCHEGRTPHGHVYIAPAPPTDQRDEKIALLSQEVLQLRRDLKAARSGRWSTKTTQEAWWEAMLAAAGPGVTAKQAAHFAKQALEEYHQHREPPPSEAPTTDEGDPEDRAAGGDADGPEGGAEAG